MLPPDAHRCQADINLKERRNGWDRGEPQSDPLVSGSPSVQVPAPVLVPVIPVQNAPPGGQHLGQLARDYLGHSLLFQFLFILHHWPGLVKQSAVYNKIFASQVQKARHHTR
jgi:hypothetical protein